MDKVSAVIVVQGWVLVSKEGIGNMFCDKELHVENAICRAGWRPKFWLFSALGLLIIIGSAWPQHYRTLANAESYLALERPASPGDLRDRLKLKYDDGSTLEFTPPNGRPDRQERVSFPETRRTDRICFAWESELIGVAAPYIAA